MWWMPKCVVIPLGCKTVCWYSHWPVRMAAVRGWSKSVGSKLHADANLLSWVVSISLAVDSIADCRSFVAFEFLLALRTSSNPGLRVAFWKNFVVVPWSSVMFVNDAQSIS